MTARHLRISQGTLEAWLAGPAVAWGREPSYLSQIGALSLLYTRAHHVAANRGAGKDVRPTRRKSAAAKERAATLLKEGRTVSEVADMLGVSEGAIYKWRREDTPAPREAGKQQP